MIKLENYEVVGWEHAIRGMRNPMNSWAKSDSGKCGVDMHCIDYPVCHYADKTIGPSRNCSKIPHAGLVLGPKDHELAMKLANAGSVHGKFRRMITVYVDITAPLYWWKEFDTYKVGTVANSCSTMHKIHEKEFTLEDFSCEHLMDELIDTDTLSGTDCNAISSKEILLLSVDLLNEYRVKFLETKDKSYWWQMIQLLPSSYNQKRTVQLNYEVLAGMYKYRKNHKLDEWVEFCKWIEDLPYSEIILGKNCICDVGCTGEPGEPGVIVDSWDDKEVTNDNT